MTTNNEPGPELRSESGNPFETTWGWKGGGIAGLLATVAMGVAISLMHLPTLQIAIAGLYGQSGNLGAGWVAHGAHGTLFGMVFALVLSDPGLYRLTDWYWKTILAGVTFSMMLAVVGAGIIMPIWLGFSGFSTPPQIPNVTVPVLIWHLVYGLVLGGIFPVLGDI